MSETVSLGRGFFIQTSGRNDVGKNFAMEGALSKIDSLKFLKVKSLESFLKSFLSCRYLSIRITSIYPNPCRFRGHRYGFLVADE